MFRSKKGNSNPSEGKRTKKKDVNAMFGFDMDPDDDDDDLEAELLALTGNPDQQSKKKQAKKDVSLAEIQAMAEEGLRDVDEDDISDVDEDDDLLSELADLTGGEAPAAVPMPTSESTPRSPNAGIVKLIEERKSLYERAVARANADGEKSKSRRFGRSLKTCEELLKAAQRGQHVDEAEVPPPVHVPSKEEPVSNPRPQPASAPPVSPDVLDKPKPASRPGAAEKPKPAPRPSAPTPEQTKPAPAPPAAKRPVPTPRSDAMTAQPVVVVSNPEPSDEGDADDLIKAVLSLLHERLTQYRSAAIQAKKGGDKGTAVEFMKKAKYFEQTVASIQKEEEVDLSQIPSAPPGFETSAKSQLTLQKLNEMAPDSEPVPEPSPSPSPSPVPQEIPSKPTSLLEGLEQRLAKYQSAVELAKNDGQSGKARRMNRIVGQYKEAIQACKSKKSYAYDELPAPPGFPPLPLSHQSPSAGALMTASAPSIESSRLVQTSPRPATLQTFPAPRSTNDEQLDRLVHRQTELKKAALQAKHDGNVDLAKKIFFQAKSMDQMIEAARGGIKVDMSQMPSLSPSPQPPAVEAAAPKINVERTEADDETLARLESTLSKQVDLAKRMELYYNGTGHLKEAAEYRDMVRSSQRDLDAVKNALSYQKPVPRFHYEYRAFSKLNVFPELSESEVEVVVVRGINLPLPKKVEANDFDTYVTVEFPYPQEDSPSAKTSVIKGTDNPTYEHSMKFPIDRKQRAFGRALKRRPVRAELWHSRSWSLFRGDQSLGEVAIRIDALETKCEVHECADLTANRKQVGGKLEIRVRLRQPLQGDDVNVVKERWLVIDHPPSSSLHRRSPSPRRESSPDPETTSIGPTISSIMSFRVVQAELQSAEKTIAQMKSHRQKPPKVYDHRVRECREKLSSIQTEMKRGGKAYIASYVKRLAGKVAEEQALAAQLVRAGSRSDAAAALHRKKIMENEIKEWKVKFHI